jgi:quinol monooxygenase YgiN
MSITVIVELKAHPGRRDELQSVYERLLAQQSSGLRGFLGSRRYENLDDPDTLVEVAEWESADARALHMREASAAGTYASLAEHLAAPFRVTVLSPMA